MAPASTFAFASIVVVQFRVAFDVNGTLVRTTASLPSDCGCQTRGPDNACNASGRRVCQASCPAGQALSNFVCNSVAFDAATCTSCAAGSTFKAATGSQACTTCDTCGQGTTILTDCTVTANRQCAPASEVLAMQNLRSALVRNNWAGDYHCSDWNSGKDIVCSGTNPRRVLEVSC
jgi:hypothetical protein